jgi:hypothetical protein
MQTVAGMPRGVAIAIDDMLDHCANIKPGQEVVLLAHVDGTCGGDSLVDPQVIAWLQAAIQHRGANASVLWIDEPDKPHAWRIPPVYMAALKACDVVISHSFNLTTEEFHALRETATEHGVALVRNLATTPSLLNTAWAQTPYELVAQIRYQACTVFQAGLPFELTADNGTHLKGTILPPKNSAFNPAMPSYTNWRSDGLSYRPFPEWVFPPIGIADVSGVYVFDRMHPWWGRYVGVPPVFKDPIRLTIEKNHISRIEGKDEAAALKKFLAFMSERIDDPVYDFSSIHSGVHPQAEVGPQQCPSPGYRRLIEHGHSSYIHGHIGRNRITPKYPYWMHVTADIRDATWRVGEHLVHDRGRMTALDHPDVLAVAAKYPGRPGVNPVTREGT